MADQLQPGSETSVTPPASENTITGLVGGIINDAQELIGQQLALFRNEVREDLRKTREAALPLAIGVGVLLVGMILMPFMLAHLLYWATDYRLALWGCYGIVGGVFIVLGAVLAYLGKKKFDSFNPLPDETAEVLKENVQWIMNPKQSANK
jgi:hypothetical protein